MEPIVHAGPNINDVQFIVRLILAIGLGGVIGLERQWRQRLAGLRTNVLVSAGASLYMMLTDAGQIPGDGTRIAAQIVSGVGFLGAGVIMKEGLSVRGLNTAATIWCSAAVGCLAGLGLGFKATVAGVTILACNVLLRPLVQKINRTPKIDGEEVEYLVRAKCNSAEEGHVRNLILQAVSSGPLVLKSLDSEDVENSARTVVTAKLESAGKQHSLLEHLMSRLGIEPGIVAISWTMGRAELGEA